MLFGVERAVVLSAVWMMKTGIKRWSLFQTFGSDAQQDMRGLGHSILNEQRDVGRESNLVTRALKHAVASEQLL